MEDIDWDKMISQQAVATTVKFEKAPRDPDDSGADSDDSNNSDYDIIPPMYKYHSKKPSVGTISLCRSGAYIDTTDMETVRTIKGWFTLKTKVQRSSKFFKTITDHTYNKGRIRVPRFGIFMKLAKLKNMGELNFSNPIIDNQIKSTNLLHYTNPEDFVEWDATLDHNQIITSAWLMKNIFTEANAARGMAGCIVKMPTGVGKTYLGSSIIHELGGPTLVICRDTGDCEQWVRTLEVIFPEVRIGQYHGTVKRDGDIIVAVVNSVFDATEFRYHMGRGHPKFKRGVDTVVDSSKEFLSRFKLIVWDECHTYCSKSGIKAFMKAQAPYMIGLSATPNDRPDKFDPIAHWNIGPVVDAQKLPGYKNDTVSYKCKIKAIEYEGPSEFIQPIMNKAYGNDKPTISTTLMIKQFASDPYRLQLICKHIKQLYKKGHNTVVFADRKEFLEIISKALKQITSIKSTVMIDDESYDSVKTLVGGAKKDTIAAATMAGRIILTTYAYFGTGKSIKRLDAIIFATPRKSHINQFIGRIFRKGSDPTIRRRVIDIIDCKTSLRSQYYARKVVYDMQHEISRKVKICKVKVKWTKFHVSNENGESGDDNDKATAKKELPEDALRALIKSIMT